MTTSKSGEKPKKGGRRVLDNNGLTANEHAFVLHYLGAANGVIFHAMRMAGYKSGSDRNMRAEGHRVMARPRVIAAIEKEREFRAERLRFSADDVLREQLRVLREAELLPNASKLQGLKLRRETLKDIGEHVSVGAFRRNIGLSSPTGSAIQVEDVTQYEHLSDEELEALARAREILDRGAGHPPDDPVNADDTRDSGEATT
ncbi:MAG: terminase small subunit [Sphingomonas sp.]